MKNLIHYTLLFSLTTNLIAQTVSEALSAHSPYRNLREAHSALITDLNAGDVKRLHQNYKSMDVLRTIISDKTINRCATKIVAAIENQLNLSKDNEVERAILSLRLDDSLDDISTNILVKAAKLSRPVPLPFAKNNLNSEEEEKALEIFATKTKDIKNKKSCLEDTFRNLVSKLTNESPKFGMAIKHINKLALDHALISESEFKKLEKMRFGKVHEWPLTLSSYGQNLESIAASFPDRIKESSELMTDNSEGKFRNKKSLRQSLYEKYNSTQIMLLANMVRDLKKRLEAKDITININYVDQESEIINLTPMEKFRFILKLLRKELATINNSSLLDGNRANYIDIIAAAYEVGYINASEIEQLASLEDIWNPKKSTKEKVMVWVQRFGGVASVLLPPPFGFVSVMAIMLIDQYISEAPVDRDPEYNIF